MEPQQKAAAALALGEPLAALSHVALLGDPVSLALRGIALAQIGDLARAKLLLTRAEREFGPHQTLARARCVTALAEVALAARDLEVPLSTLRGALRALEAHGDLSNALHARVLLTRSLMVSGQLALAERMLGEVQLLRAPPPLRARAELMRAELSLRRLDIPRARRALARARQAAERAEVRIFSGELARLDAALEAPAARLIRSGETTSLRLEAVAQVFRQLSESEWLLDCCQRVLRCGARRLELARRPVLFALLRALAEAWPASVPRDALAQRGFGVTRVNASHRARLRVELGRLRKLLDRGHGHSSDEPAASSGAIHADAIGYRLEAPPHVSVSVLVPPIDGDDAALVALLADGAAWSSSALALTLGASQRTLQRLLAELQARGLIHAVGHGRARRWCAAPLTHLGPQVYGLFSYGAGRRAP